MKLLFGLSSEILSTTSAFSRQAPGNMREITESEAMVDDVINKEPSSSRPGTRHQSGNISYIPSSTVLQDGSSTGGQQSAGTGSIPTSNERGVSVS